MGNGPTEPTEPSEYEQQTAAHWYLIYKDAHEIGLMAQRQLEALNALPDGRKLFLTRAERRRLPHMPE